MRRTRILLLLSSNLERFARLYSLGGTRGSISAIPAGSRGTRSALPDFLFHVSIAHAILGTSERSGNLAQQSGGDYS